MSRDLVEALRKVADLAAEISEDQGLPGFRLVPQEVLALLEDVEEVLRYALVLEARVAKLKALLPALLQIADKASSICSIFEIHEYPEIEAQPVVTELRELLAREDVRRFLGAAR